VTPDAAAEVRRRYFREHGTTLRGLMTVDRIDPHEFLAFVHDIDLACVPPDPALAAALKQLDYSEHGGAPLLGVRGVSIISHGKSSPRAIKNALKAAVRAVDSGMNEHIGRRLERGAA